MAKRPDDYIEQVLARLTEATDEMRIDIKEIKNHMTGLHVTAKEHKIILEEHMRRTALNERAVELLDKKDQAVQDALSSRIVPLERNVAMWAGAAKVFTIITALLGIAVAIWKVLASR